MRGICATPEALRTPTTSHHGKHDLSPTEYELALTENYLVPPKSILYERGNDCEALSAENTLETCVADSCRAWVREQTCLA